MQKHTLLASACALALVSAAAARSEATDPAVTVAPVLVSAHAYAIPQVTSGTRTESPLVLTPMAIQVVPRDVIDDRAQRTVLDAVQAVSGVELSTYEFYDQFLIRGFDSGYGATYRNGLQMRGLTNAVDMAFVDHIEVIKGPASMLYGRIEPGGFVNVVTRKPEPTTSYSGVLQGGDFGQFRATADGTGKLTADGSLLYRVDLDYDRAESWVANAHRRSLAVSGALTWTPNTRLTADFQIEHYSTRSTWLDSPIPVIGDHPAALPRDFTIIDPISWSDYPYTVDRTLLALQWSYQLTPAWKLTHRLHYIDSTEDQQGVYADGFDGVDSYTGIRFTHTGPGWTRSTLATNFDIAGDIQLGGLRHQMLVGADWSRFTDDTPGSTGALPGAAPLNVFHPGFPDYGAQLAVLARRDATNIIWRDRSWDAGIYAQDQIEVGGRLIVLISGRYDWAQDSYPDTYGSRTETCYPHCTALPLVAYPVDKAFSPRAAALYRLTDNASLYFSYAKSFGSSNGRDANGDPMKPQIGEQYEVGAKAALLNGRLTTTVSLYTLTKTNIPEYDPINYFPHVVGEARSRGVEIDALGQINRNVSLIAAYTYDDAIITRDPYSGTQGKRLSGVAPNFGSLWLKWDSQPAAKRGWSFGAGVYVTDTRWGDDLNTWKLPAYARLDAMAAYRFRMSDHKITVQLNINNLTDTSYFDHGGYGMAAYGAPRTVLGTVRVEY